MNWKDIPKSQKIVFTGLLLAALVFGAKRLSGSIVKGMQESEQVLIQLQAERENLALAEEELDGGKTETALKEELKALEAAMPQEIDGQFLLKQFATSAAKHGIEIVRIEPEAIRAGETKEAPDGSPVQGPGTQPVLVKMNASFADMVHYIKEIENQNSLLSTTALTGHVGKKGLDRLDIDATFEIMLAPKNDAPETEGHNLPPEHRQKEDESIEKPEPTPPPLQVNNLHFVSREPKKQGEEKPLNKAVAAEGLQGMAMTSGKAPPAPLPFTIDGFLGKTVLVKGEIFKLKDRIEGWTLIAIDPTRGEIHLEQNGIKSVLIMQR